MTITYNLMKNYPVFIITKIACISMLVYDYFIIVFNDKAHI